MVCKSKMAVLFIADRSWSVFTLFLSITNVFDVFGMSAGCQDVVKGSIFTEGQRPCGMFL